MGSEIRNASVEQAQADLAEQLAPRTEGASGAQGLDQNFEATTAELERLEDEMRIGHDAKSRA